MHAWPGRREATNPYVVLYSDLFRGRASGMKSTAYWTRRVALVLIVLSAFLLNSSVKEQALAIANASPVFPGDTDTRSVQENSLPGTDVGYPIVASDADGDTLAYSLSGADAGLFHIDKLSGQITVGANTTLDRETTSYYRVVVTASEQSGTSSSISVTIVVTDMSLGVAADYYDLDKNERVDDNEVLSAVRDYFGGILDGDEVLGVIRQYFSPSPIPVPGYVSVSSGHNHVCGLREDGSVVCWGDDQYGQSSPPEDERFTSISRVAIATPADCGRMALRSVGAGHPEGQNMRSSLS